MIRYLLDTNALVQAKRKHYGFDFCPEFWDWLVMQNRKGEISSVDKAFEERRVVSDELALWAKKRGDAFFLTPDGSIAGAFHSISAWVNAKKHADEAITEFLDVADYRLVAHAYAYDWTVATRELSSKSNCKAKIPDACKRVNVESINPFEMLRREKARFVLGPSMRTHRTRFVEYLLHGL